MIGMKEMIQNIIDGKTKPVGSLGKLEALALKIALIQGSDQPCLRRPTMLVFAADHGLADEGVSLYPKEVTRQMVMNFLQGGAAINVFCKQNGIHLKVVDAGVDFDFPPDTGLIQAKIAQGSRNILQEPAMSREECIRAMEEGKRLVALEHDQGCNVIGFGEMGIGNTSAASLLMHKYTGLDLVSCTGRGTGHNDRGLAAKLVVLKEAAGKYSPKNPLDVLSTFGGLEIAMMCGAMLEAGERNMLIMVDGFISSSAILAASFLKKDICEQAIFCHVSGETGHRAMLKYLKAEPVVDLGLRLGEGTGVALVYPLLKSAVNFLNEMASFESAGISDKKV